MDVINSMLPGVLSKEAKACSSETLARGGTGLSSQLLARLIDRFGLLDTWIRVLSSEWQLNETVRDDRNLSVTSEGCDDMTNCQL